MRPAFPAILLLLASAALATAADPFQLLDADKDGKLSATELPQAAGFDKDGDGFITKEEFTAATGGLANRIPASQLGKVEAVKDVIRATGQFFTVTPKLKDFDAIKDVDYVGAGNPRQKLDLLLPKDRKGKKRPLVVFIHGGGWEGGKKDDCFSFIPQYLSIEDYSVAAINYRLSKEAPWPAQIHDCKAAIRFLRGKAEEYGIDPEKIGVVGFSAGGHLAAMLGTSNKVAALEGNLGPFASVSSEVECVVNVFGVTNFFTYFGKDTTAEQIIAVPAAAKLLGKTKEEMEKNGKEASPVTWISKDDPPFFTAHGTKDPIVPFTQAVELDELLKKAGVETHLVAMEEGGHLFFSAELNGRIHAFFDQHLRGVKADEISTRPIMAVSF